MRSLSLGIAAALVGVGSACSALGGEEEDPASDVVDALAAALAGHSLGEVPLTDEADRAGFAELVEPLGDVPVAVQVVSRSRRPRHRRRRRWRGAGSSPTSRGGSTSPRSRWSGARTGGRSTGRPPSLVPDLADGDALGLRTLTPDRGDITGRAVRCW